MRRAGGMRAGCGGLRWNLYSKAFSGCRQSWMSIEIVVAVERGGAQPEDSCGTRFLVGFL
jgi:hypothetical protein